MVGNGGSWGGVAPSISVSGGVFAQALAKTTAGASLMAGSSSEVIEGFQGYARAKLETVAGSTYATGGETAVIQIPASCKAEGSTGTAVMQSNQTEPALAPWVTDSGGSQVRSLIQRRV